MTLPLVDIILLKSIRFIFKVSVTVKRHALYKALLNDTKTISQIYF